MMNNSDDMSKNLLDLIIDKINRSSQESITASMESSHQSGYSKPNLEDSKDELKNLHVKSCCEWFKNKLKFKGHAMMSGKVVKRKAGDKTEGSKEPPKK